jgi:integrase
MLEQETDLLPPKTVQTFAGHSSLQVTMDRYGHLFPSENHNHVMDAISKEIYAVPEPTRARASKNTAKTEFAPG